VRALIARACRDAPELIIILGVLFFALGAMLLLSGIIIATDSARDDERCETYQNMTGFETVRPPHDVCYVRRDGRWWRWDEYLVAYTPAKEKP
jgi:hypothetical protein